MAYKKTRFIKKIEHFGSNLKTKHLDIKMKRLCDLKLKNEIQVTLVPSEDMISDTLTKASYNWVWLLSLQFSTMHPSLKSQYQNLSQHCIAQTAYWNPSQSNGPQYAGKMY
ncbi:hypothetical protein VP01_7430g1, partial [Puccinia sorghi]